MLRVYGSHNFSLGLKAWRLKTLSLNLYLHLCCILYVKFHLEPNYFHPYSSESDLTIFLSLIGMLPLLLCLLIGIIGPLYLHLHHTKHIVDYVDDNKQSSHIALNQLKSTSYIYPQQQITIHHDEHTTGRHRGYLHQSKHQGLPQKGYWREENSSN